MKFPQAFTILLILFVGAPISSGQNKTNPSPSQACTQFVGQFYSWYLAKESELMKGKSQKSAFEVTLVEKKSWFTPGLLKALKEDLAASRKSPGEIVGLDFDPFLDAQEEWESHILGKVTAKGDHYLVEVFGVLGGKKSAKPDVVAELAFEKGNWIFINFHYPGSDIPVNENLISVLKELKRSREEDTK